MKKNGMFVNMELVADRVAELCKFDPMDSQVTFSRLDGGGWQCYVQRMICDHRGVSVGTEPNCTTAVGEGKTPEDALQNLWDDLDMLYK